MADSLEILDGGKAWYLCDPPMVLGEAPIYRASDSTLHWVDCLKTPPELHILCVDPETGAPRTRQTQGGCRARVLQLADSVTVQFFRRNQPGSYICAYYQGIAFLDEETGRLDVVKEIIPTTDRDKRRFNDGGIDAFGRFWLAEIDIRAARFGAGRLPEIYGEPVGRLWRYAPDGNLREMDRGFICGNGLAWSPDNKTMYINDSVAMKVYKYDFDLQAGAISNRQLFIDRRGSHGEPDGMVIDTTGNLWVAFYDSYRLMVYSPDGTHLKDVVFTAKNPTCPTWGGENWDLLFVTTGQDREGTAKAGDEGGHMFLHRVSAGTRGKGKNEFAG